MQFKSFISSTLLLGVVAFFPAINTQEIAVKPSPKKPFVLCDRNVPVA